MNKAHMLLSIVAGFVILITGCGSKSKGTSDVTATFKDSPVEGLSYICTPSGTLGQTTEEGKLTCKKGDEAEFLLGAMTFGPVKVREGDVITPYRFFPDDEEAAVNLAQLLQSLDDDGDYEEVITLLPSVVDAIVTQNLDLTASDFDTLANTMLTENNASMSLVSEQVARNHLEDSVSDTTAPIVTVQGETAVEVVQGTVYEDQGAVANDDVHGFMTAAVSGEVDTSTPGTYTITYSATDAAGNTGSASRIVTVIEGADEISPIVTLNGEVNVTIEQNSTYIDAGATAEDDRDGVIEPVMSGEVNSAVLGTYTITWTATDAAGNVGMVERIVIVVKDTGATPTTPEELEASAIGDACIATDGSSGIVAKDQDPFGNPIPGTATCEVTS